MKKFILTLTMLVFSPLAQAECLSHVVGACGDNGYNPDAVVEFYTQLAEAWSSYNTSIGQGLQDSGGCITSCESAYRSHVSACKALPTDDPAIGTRAVSICLQQAENVYSQCVLRCMQPNNN